jgi:integrase
MSAPRSDKLRALRALARSSNAHEAAAATAIAERLSRKLGHVETVDEWYARYDAWRITRGEYSRMSAWRRWVSPRIGGKTWRDVSAIDVESIRDDLDAAMVARKKGAGLGRLLGRTAVDVWGALTGAIRVARRSKVRSLRVLAGGPDPCADVEPPGDRRSRKSRRKTFIYPVEFLALVSCTKVPRAWRQLYAIAAYTYLRPGELRVLRWSDVDLTHRLIHVTKAWHYAERRVKEPKTIAGYRDVPLEPRLEPLLRRMRERAKPGDLVAPLLSSMHRVSIPPTVRRHLMVAGVDREALHKSTTQNVRANFRTWRDTGITWLALAGVDIARIMRRAGHEDVRATMRYVKAAEDLSRTMGAPFPVLPRELLGTR